MRIRVRTGRTAVGVAGAGLILTLAACGMGNPAPHTEAAPAKTADTTSQLRVNPDTTSTGSGTTDSATPNPTAPTAPTTQTPTSGTASTSTPTTGSPGAKTPSTRTPGTGTPTRTPGTGISNTGTPVDASISHGTEDGGRSIALTFDDGPDPTWTPQVLALLARHNAKATFCMIGPNAQAHPEQVKAVVAAGNRLCDHSMHHNTAQSKESVGYNRNEIEQADRLIERAAGPGAHIRYYRAPGGDFTPWIRDIAVHNDLRPLGWGIDSQDWKRQGADTILQNITGELKPGRILLMHDGGGDRSESVQALAKLLDHLDAHGYTYSFPQA
ncbi:polysaccharide deacetylase family protein [Embleya sp. NPDC020630]|uniref:polysaccharide deacetylase family protein n=1 Tax=Embleya sp. NPDC020630 TaxID=3363979 RepID=UPI0037AE8200